MLHSGNVGISAMPSGVAADRVNATGITNLVGDEFFYSQYTTLANLISMGNVKNEKG